MTQLAPRISGILPKEKVARRTLSLNDILDDLAVIVPNARVAVLLQPTSHASRRVAVDPSPSLHPHLRDALDSALSAWLLAHASRLRAPRLPECLRPLLPVDRLLIIPIRWGAWLAGVVAVDAQWAEATQIAALQELASNLAVRIATEDWAGRNEEVSGIMLRLPSSIAV